jgi:hypothetical protein
MENTCEVEARRAEKKREFGKANDIRERLCSDSEEYHDVLAELDTTHLLRRARRARVPISQYILDRRDWRTGPFGNRYLRDEAFERVYLVVQRNSRARVQFYQGLVGTAIGLIGALTGLIAVLTRR